MLFNKIQRAIRIWYALKTRCWYALFFRKSGKNNTIIRPVLLTPSCIALGNFVFIRNGGRIEGISVFSGIAYTPLITFGDYVSIEQNVHITCASKIEIGSNTAIAANVTITDIDHTYTDISLPPERQPIKVTPVQIGPHCKIYNNAVILPGTILGKHTVVAANAVVLGREYPAFCVLAGAPAKVVKQYNFTTGAWVTAGKLNDTIK